MEQTTVQERSDDAVNRREATKTIGALSLQLLGFPVWEQFSRIIVHSSSLEKTTLDTLATATGSLWQLSETLPPSSLIHSVEGYFETLAQLLSGAPPLSLYQPLTSLAAEVAQIAARLFFDMKGYQESETCYDISIELAQRAENPVLQAVGVARKARDLLQMGNPQQAQTHLLQAPSLSSQPGAPIADAYLAVVWAKALSHLGQTEACLNKLDEAHAHVENIRSDEDFYWTEFDASLLDDFRGDCYLQLQQFSQAQTVFQEALDLGKSSSTRHQSSVLIGLANALMRQGELEQSCTLAQQALQLTAQTQSWMIFQYLLQFRGQLDPWKQESCVKHLDEQIIQVRVRMPQ